MLNVTEDQVRGFRLRRLGLLDGGHPDLVAAARAQLGGQAQLIHPTVLGLALRTADAPPAEAVKDAVERDNVVVRAWGQRDTVHVYDPADWPLIVAARPAWGKNTRGRLDSTPDGLVDEAEAFLLEQHGPVTRSDFKPLVTDAWLADIREDYLDTDEKKWRFCTGRLIWHLGNRGRLSHGPREGEQAYWPRHVAFPGLDFADAELEPVEAASRLAYRYLGSYGPATPHDIAHFFGANVSAARQWVERIRDGLIDVRCGDRELLARAEDEADLRGAATGAPILLPGYDNLLMGHADKHWTVPIEPERKQVWKKAAVVSAVVLDRGVVVATWKHKVQAKQVTIEVSPLEGWASPDLSAAAQALAAHHEREKARVVVK